MSLHDTALEERLLALLNALELTIDNIGPTPLRQLMDEKIIEARNALVQFDQNEFESGESKIES